MGRRNRERITRIKTGVEEPRVPPAEERREQREMEEKAARQLMGKLLVTGVTRYRIPK